LRAKRRTYRLRFHEGLRHKHKTLGFNADLIVLNSFLRPAYGESQRKILTRMLQSAQRKRLGAYQIGSNETVYNRTCEQPCSGGRDVPGDFKCGCGF
jgi:hypothetical protein